MTTLTVNNFDFGHESDVGFSRSNLDKAAIAGVKLNKSKSIVC